jgi:alpha-L-fucosidase
MLSECRKQSNKSRGYKHFLRRAVLSIVLGSLFSAYLLGQTTRQDQSIAPQSAAQIDEAWQKASAKYDKPRNALLATVERESTRGPFQPDWQSLAKYRAPDWYRDAKFGIFIHWVLYSVPAFGSEWYPREMYLEGSTINQHHVATYGPADEVRLQGLHPDVQGRAL